MRTIRFLLAGAGSCALALVALTVWTAEYYDAPRRLPAAIVCLAAVSVGAGSALGAVCGALSERAGHSPKLAVALALFGGLLAAVALAPFAFILGETILLLP